MEVRIESTHFERVIVESPYKGSVEHHKTYARAAMADCTQKKESPYASHLLLTQPGVLQDGVKEERDKGIAAGFAWRTVADKTVVYIDLGISSGMREGIKDARWSGRPVEYRTLSEWGEPEGSWRTLQEALESGARMFRQVGTSTAGQHCATNLLQSIDELVFQLFGKVKDGK